MQNTNVLTIRNRRIGADFPPFVIAEIGINHEGDMGKACRMIEDARAAGAECVKFQCHVVEDEMVPAAKHVVPGHTKESIWDIMERCAFSEQEEGELKAYAEGLGMIYLCTPFSRAAADRLEALGLAAYKIGSGECNNYPLVEHIASFGKPIILSTGMNDIASIAPSVEILRAHRTPFALMHCTSMYPTPYDKVRLGGIADLLRAFPDSVVGLSDHSIGNYACFGAVPLGASILEKHFTSDKGWSGPDIAISIDPAELKDLVAGSRAIHEAKGGRKDILSDEQDIINFAYACVVSIRAIAKGDIFTKENIWVKRPGTGEIRAREFQHILGKRAAQDILPHTQLTWDHINSL